ncbi:MAG: CHASE2 domain-containing protein, partial [Chitinivibrionales bacterium]|nr:CHASE2 domain-containing protein [Chitinivibrionales bacterium]
MELLGRISKSLLVGLLVGTAIALFTNFFFKPLIDRLEWQTYDMRYRWEFEDAPDPDKQKAEDLDNGIYIIDIDDRSQQKLGKYWLWDRSYHAEMINTLQTHFPAAIIFDILFYDPEDHLYAQRLEALIEKCRNFDPDIVIDEPFRNAIPAVTNYDQQFVQAVKNSRHVYFGIRMANLNDYPEYAQSQVKPKMALEWHSSLHPSSTIELPADIRKEFFNVSNEKPIIDGIFTDLAKNARDIGYVNMVPAKDGTIRSLPIFFAFGKNKPVYFPISVRTVATLFATPIDEIDFHPQKYLDIGKPFKIFKDKSGAVSYSYPNVTTAQVKAIIKHKDEILSLKPDQSVEISSLTKVGHDGSGVFLEMYCGYFTGEIIDIMLKAPYDKIFALKEGEELRLSDETSIMRDSDIEWVLSAPYGDEEWWMSKMDLKTLSLLTPDDFSIVREGQTKLLFHT